jgi:predicted nucleotidyltransferase
VDRGEAAHRQAANAVPVSRRTVVDRRGNALDLRPLDTLVARIVETWSPAQIWLFGSRARGDAQDHSDWDLLIVLPDNYSAELDPIETWRIGREARVRADIVSFKVSEFEEDRSTPNTLAYDAATAGVLVYER